MRSTRKIVLFVLVCLTSLLRAQVFAEDLNGWTLTYTEATEGVIDRGVNYAEVTSSDKYNGGYSMLIAYPKEKQKNTSMSVKNNLTKTLEHGTYNFSFYLKGEFDAYGIYAGIGNDSDTTQGSLVRLSNTGRFTVEDVGNGWSFYQFNNVVFDTSDSYFTLNFSYNCKQIYIDGVTLIKNGENENLIINGDFESGFEDTAPTVRRTQYDPKNVIVNQLDYSAAVSWRNPYESPKQISLYSITDGNDILISSSYNLAADAVNRQLIGNLIKSKSYKYRLVFDFNNHESTEFIFYAKTASKDKDNIQSWSCVVRENNPDGYLPVKVNVDTETYYDGSTSAHMASNITGGQGEFGLCQNVVLDSSKEYELSFWTKIKNVSGVSILINGEEINGSSVIASESETITTRWKKIIYRFTNISSGNLEVSVKKQAEDFWIDNFELYEVSDGKTVGSNLIQNGSFEDGLTNSTPNVLNNVVANVDKNKAVISWDLPDRQHEKINVYLKDGNTLSLRGVVQAGETSIAFNKLQIDMEYEYYLTISDLNGNESDGVIVTARWIAAPYVISDFQFYNESGDLVSKIEPGQINVHISVKNNSMGNNFNAILITQLFKDDKIIDIVHTEKLNIPQTSALEETKTDFDIYINVPKGDYRLETFLWSGLSEMIVLKPYAVLK